MAVVRHVGAEPPVGLVGTLVDQDVLRLAPTEAVVVELLEPVEPGERLVGGGRLGVATVEEPGAVVGPGGAREFDPPEMIVQVARGGDVAHVKLFPVRAARGGPVGEEAAVLRHPERRHGDGPVLRKQVRIEQHLRLAAERGLLVQHRLVLEPVVLEEEVPPPPPPPAPPPPPPRPRAAPPAMAPALVALRGSPPAPDS